MTPKGESKTDSLNRCKLLRYKQRIAASKTRRAVILRARLHEKNRRRNPCVPFSLCGKVNAHPPLLSRNTSEKLPQKQALLRPLRRPRDTKEITCNRFLSTYFVQMFSIVFSLYATIMLSSGKPITYYNKIFVSSEARRYAASCVPLCSKSPEAAE